MSGPKLKQRPHKKGLPGNQSQYSDEFKKQVVEAYLEGEDDQRLVASRFGVSQTSVNLWLKKYLSNQQAKDEDKLTLVMKKKAEKGNKELEQRVKELEKALEEERLKRIGYQTMIDIAEKELKIDIRKKSDTKQSEK
jgi:transposase-like protein